MFDNKNVSKEVAHLKQRKALVYANYGDGI